MSSLETKKEKLSLLSLPEDLLFSCLARVSRLYYPTLSLVSKHFRSLLASPELYNARSLLGLTESCLYVCVRFSDGYRWFTLSRKPPEYFLAAVRVPLSPPFAERSVLVAVGSNIYKIFQSSSVSILDCPSHTWREAPNLGKTMLTLNTASVFDQKIYVKGSYNDSDSSKNLVQVFDTKTGSFDPVLILGGEIHGEFFPGSACIEGKFYVSNGGEVVSYNSEEGRWDQVEEMGMYMYIGRINGEFRWYNSNEQKWREVKGLVGELPEFTGYSCVKVVDYGGKMVVFWEKARIVGIIKEKKIWCAEITFERRNSCEIWGKVEWQHCMLILPHLCYVEKVLVTTL